MARIAVVGPGKVGTALSLAFNGVGHTIVGAYCRDVDSLSAKRFRRLLGAPTALLPRDISDSNPLPTAEVFLVAVPDRAVTSVAQTLADSGILATLQQPLAAEATAYNHAPAVDSTGPVVMHTAGSLSAEALAPARNVGARCICMHPLQTIADPELSPECFSGITFTLDGDPSACALISQWIRRLGGIPLQFDPKLRSGYHAAAVLASNAVVALMATASEVSGLPTGAQALIPLLQGAVDNLKLLGLPDALTGPVERGDVDTVKKHLDALQSNPTALRVYRALGQATLEVASKKGPLSSAVSAELRDLFQ